MDKSKVLANSFSNLVDNTISLPGKVIDKSVKLTGDVINKSIQIP